MTIRTANAELNSPPSKKKAPGSRRRNSSKHQAILHATRELVEEKGVRGLSIQLIATRAKVSRNVLYNWWNGDIEHIVEEALLPNVDEWPLPDHGNFKQDIEQLIELSIDALNKPNVLKGFLLLAAETVNEPAILRETARHFRAPYAKIVAHIIKNASGRGEIEPTMDPKIIAQVISGSVVQLAISKTLGRRKTKQAVSEIVCKLLAK